MAEPARGSQVESGICWQSAPPVVTHHGAPGALRGAGTMRRLVLALALASAAAHTVLSTNTAPLPPTPRDVALRRIAAMRHASTMTRTDVEPDPAGRTSDQDDGDIDYPGPLSAPQRLARAATFWSRALPVVFSYLRLQTAFNIREQILGQCLEDEECEVQWEQTHEAGAATLKEAIELLKGFYGASRVRRARRGAVGARARAHARARARAPLLPRARPQSRRARSSRRASTCSRGSTPTRSRASPTTSTRCPPRSSGA